MTDKKNLADAVRNRTTAGGPPRTHQSPGRRRWTDVLMHRWPTALGIAVAALAAFDLQDVQDGLEFAALTVLMALIYLGAAALDRPWSAWIILLVGLPLAVFISSISGIDSSVVLLVAAPVFLVLGVARGQWQSAKQGSRAFVRGVLCLCGPPAGRGHPVHDVEPSRTAAVH